MNFLKRYLLHKSTKRVFPVIILAYHDILPLKTVGSNIYTVSLRNFTQHIRMIKKYFHVIPLKDIVLRENTKKATVIITFDDGHRNNYEYAFPVLKRESLKATFFVNTDFIGSSDACLNREQIIEMHRNSMEISSHGASHRDFSTLDQDEILFELKNSKEVLEKMLGSSVVTFAYPHGKENSICSYDKVALKNLGYKYACLYGARATEDVKDS